MSIGIFDSGFGGLTVLKEMIATFPEESFIYLGDTARLPYGTKSPDVIRRYLEQNIAFLQKHSVDAIVVACNSASSVLTEEEQFGVPIYGVIAPGAKAAVQSTLSQKIGVIGTRATVEGGAYVRAIHQLDKEIKIFQQACPLLVPLVEEGLEEDPLTNLITYRYLSPLLGTGIDTLVLGCTHYPMLRKAVKKVVGANVKLVDSAEPVAEQMRKDLEAGLWTLKKSESPHFKIFASDAGSCFKAVADKILAPLKVPNIEAVDIVS